MNPKPKATAEQFAALHEWELVQEEHEQGFTPAWTHRLRIDRGWLYRTIVDGIGVSMIFVRDVLDIGGDVYEKWIGNHAEQMTPFEPYDTAGKSAFAEAHHRHQIKNG